MTGAQSFLLFLIVLGGVATTLRLVSRSTPTVPHSQLPQFRTPSRVVQG